MDQPENGVHFHIHWSGKGQDWERFNMRNEAEKRAAEIVLPGETYTIDEHGADCPQCRELSSKVPNSAVNSKGPARAQ